MIVDNNSPERTARCEELRQWLLADRPVTKEETARHLAVKQEFRRLSYLPVIVGCCQWANGASVVTENGSATMDRLLGQWLVVLRYRRRDHLPRGHVVPRPERGRRVLLRVGKPTAALEPARLLLPRRLPQ